MLFNNSRDKRLRGDQIEVFMMLNGYENINRNMFFSLKKDSRTRGHEVKLVKGQCTSVDWKSESTPSK